MASNNEPIETSDIAEVKSAPGRSPAATAMDQEDIVLKARRDNLVARKDMLCTKIATDIRLSSVESISDWIARVTKDIPAWREGLERIESEISKVNAESRTLGELRKHNYRWIELGKREDELIRELETIRTESASLELLIDTYAFKLNELRGLPNSPTCKNIPTEKIYYTEDAPFDSDGCGVIDWKPWSDGIELAVEYEYVPVYAGYGRCTKCDTHIHGGESHTCKPNDTSDNTSTEHIIKPPVINQSTIADPVSHPPIVSRPSHTSVIKPSACEPTMCMCQQHDAFMISGQEHYCAAAPTETSD